MYDLRFVLISHDHYIRSVRANPGRVAEMKHILALIAQTFRTPENPDLALCRRLLSQRNLSNYTVLPFTQLFLTQARIDLDFNDDASSPTKAPTHRSRS